MSGELFYQPTKGLIVQMVQDINELPFGTLTRRKLCSISDTQRSDVGIAELPRDPPLLKTETPVDTGLIHWLPLLWSFAFWSFCDGSVTVLCSYQYARLSHR